MPCISDKMYCRQNNTYLPAQNCDAVEKEDRLMMPMIGGGEDLEFEEVAENYQEKIDTVDSGFAAGMTVFAD